ncbi:MAG: 7-cyano-7-deazaguanine synthase [Clostridia bacterium]|nr:7-cyano-7-deazaguanine synthase [Clostridia bacterium]
MNLQQLLSPARKAIEDYEMINDGDKIAVGLSGGKDSVTLLYILAGLKRFYPKKFELVAITIDLGLDYDQKEVESLKNLCAELNVEYHIVPTDIYQILFVERKEKSPCSLCSKMRRGALNTKAIELGCNKLALGHHADDLIETLFLSLFYEGRLSTFEPITYLSRANMTVIRPMIYIEEKNIRAFSKDKPVLYNPCPADKYTQREYVKNLINQIKKDIPIAKDRMLSAITHPERNHLFDDAIEKYAREMNELKNKKD